ncbi:terminase large subunit [Succinimonas sp.]|uniref:terminase large subunit n=1 Tax=Succinimonas sp. TaxID=1936151 RepID=UPI003863DD6D
MKRYPHVALGKEYIREALSGREKICHSALLTFERHQDDLLRAKSADYPFRFAEDKAERFISFGELLPQSVGEFYGVPFKAEPWQCAAFSIEMGWVKKKTGYRRFKQSFWFLPRKNGKSFVAAIHGTYFLCADGERNAQVYCGATTEKQANHVFEPIQSMIAQSSRLKKAFGIRCTKEEIKLPDGSFLTRIVGDGGGDGSNPHLAILDEFHEHVSRRSYETMWRGMGNRTQPMLLMITTAGDNAESICKQKYDTALRVLEGLERQDNLFAIIYEADKEDDPFSLEAIRKANPNYGVSLQQDFLEDAMTAAKADPNERNSYLTKQLNIWIQSHNAYFNMAHWAACSEPGMKLEDFVYCFGRKLSRKEIRNGARLEINPRRQDITCIMAVDLATRFDVCAVTYFFIRDTGDGANNYYAFNEYWLPEDTCDDHHNANFEMYSSWRKHEQKSLGENAKSLNVTSGAETNLVEIAGILEERAELYQAQVIIFDDWNATAVMQMIQQDGYNVAAMAWTTKHLSPGMKELKSAMLARRIHHDNNPMTNWMMSNVCSRQDANGNEFPRKPDNQVNKKIDGAATLIMCASYAVRQAENLLLSQTGLRRI